MPKQSRGIKQISENTGTRAGHMASKKKKEVVQEAPVENPQEVLDLFEKEIAAQENIQYGVALFFEGIGIIYADRPEAVAEKKRLFLEVLEANQISIDKARSLLAEAKRNPGKISDIMSFRFSGCAAHPQGGELVKRARILVRAYEEVFPSRPRDKAFTQEEVFRLMEAASEKM